MPLPHNEEVLDHLIPRIKQVQDLLEALPVLENPSTYLEFRDSTMTEQTLFKHLVEATGCGLLLDVNNVYVCARNHRFDPVDMESLLHLTP